MANDGGPAFPFIPIDHGGFQEGMSLRDYFAAAAVKGLLAALSEIEEVYVETGEQSGMSAKQKLANMAYGLADAMLAEREKAK